MHGALFDTCSISYWHGGIRKFQAALVKAMEIIRKENLVLLVSAVSIQELISWVAMQGPDAVRDFEKFIHDHFNVLDYLENCARQAAFFQARNPVQKVKPKSEMRQAVDVWFRDAALAGTAIHYSVPMIVTGDRRFAESIRQDSGFTGQVELLEETVMVTVPPPAPPQPEIDGSSEGDSPSNAAQAQGAVSAAATLRQDAAPSSN